jgi:hypothetical protein
MTSPAGVEGLTRRLIPLASVSRHETERRHLWQQQEEDSVNDSDDENDSRYRKRGLKLCGKQIGWPCRCCCCCYVITTMRLGYATPLPCTIRRCDDEKGTDKKHKTYQKRLKSCSCCSNIAYNYSDIENQSARNSGPASLCTWNYSAALKMFWEHYGFFSHRNGSSTNPHSVIYSSSPLSTEPANRSISSWDQPYEIVISNDMLVDLDDARATITEKNPLETTTASSKIHEKAHKIPSASGGAGEINGNDSVPLSQAENGYGQSTTKSESLSTGSTIVACLDLEHDLVDYTQSRVCNLPEKPDLEVIFAPSSSENIDISTVNNNNNNQIKNIEDHAFEDDTTPVGSNNEAMVCFYLRFPDAESMQQRQIDQKQRAERTADFLETAKSLSLQLGSRRGSLKSTSSYASSIGSSYDTSIGLSITTINDRGRRNQRRSSFLAGSKIERFDNSRSNIKNDSGSYVRYGSSNGAYSREDMNQHPGNSLRPQEQEIMSEEEKQHLQDLHRIRMELGYEDVEVPVKSHSEDNTHSQDGEPKVHEHRGIAELTEHLKRSRNRRGPRRSSFVAGSKIELFDNGKTPKKHSYLRASM